MKRPSDYKSKNLRIWSISMRKEGSSWIEDFILLAFFFVLVYAMVYAVLRLSNPASMEKILEILRSPIMLVVYFILGIISGIVGIKEVYFGIHRRGRISLGFALIFISAMFFLTFYILSVNILVETFNKLVTFVGF